MWKNYILALFLLVFSLVQAKRANTSDEIAELFIEPTQYQPSQAPVLEVFMHLPPQFSNVKSLKKSLGIHSDSSVEAKENRSTGQKKAFVGVRSYEITQPVITEQQNKSVFKRIKRESIQSSFEKTEPQDLSSSIHPDPDSLLPVPDAIRSPKYTTFSVKEYDIVDIGDTLDLRKRRNDSNYDVEDPVRDKRTFVEERVEGRESTTPLPFWKRRKDNPPFITGRGSIPKANEYPPAQHRSTENARESHSLKNLDKSIQSNEISRPNQDNYYSSTNRRTYSRQSDNVLPSTPKSVYDQIDYSSKKNQKADRNNFEKNQDEKKEQLNISPTHEQYNNRQYQYNYPVYNRPFYPPPYPTEIVGRGVEYYHRTYEPSTGRIIYYANMPENGKSLDYRYFDSVNRNFYFNRPFMYDPYFRNYVPPYDYMFPHNFNRPMDYMRNGRSSSQAYSQLNQKWDKYPTDDKFKGAYDKGNRFNDEVKNKTYIIYDAEETRSQSPKVNYYTDGGRMDYTSPNKIQEPYIPFRQFPPLPPLDFYNREISFNNRFFNLPPRPMMGYQSSAPLNFPNLNSNSNLRPLNNWEIQLPLTTVNRNLQPSGELDRKKI